MYKFNKWKENNKFDKTNLRTVAYILGRFDISIESLEKDGWSLYDSEHHVSDFLLTDRYISYKK